MISGALEAIICHSGADAHQTSRDHPDLYQQKFWHVNVSETEIFLKKTENDH